MCAQSQLSLPPIGLEHMARLTPPEYSRGQVDTAGDTLVRLASPSTLEEVALLEDALAIINNWRFAHRYPLNAIQVTMRGRAKSVDGHAVVPQRLKRMPAIASKL